MAEMYITEYKESLRDFSGRLISVGQEPAVANQVVSYAGTSVQSAAFQAATLFIRVVVTVDSFVLFGANPTADATKTLMVAGDVEYFGVVPGHKLAVIAK